LSVAQRDRLDALLVASPGERLTPLEVLRTPAHPRLGPDPWWTPCAAWTKFGRWA
jgi:hypothetical protein